MDELPTIVSPDSKRRGRPRSERARTAILEAAIQLMLDQGVHAVSMDEVAKQARVSKATIYRWWPSKEVLALDALDYELSPAIWPGGVDTGCLREDMLTRLRELILLFRDRPFGRVFAGIVAHAQSDPEFAELYVERFVRPRRLVTQRILESAVARGELPAGTDYELALDLFFSSFWNRTFHGYAPVDDDWAAEVVDAALAGLTSGSNSPGRKPDTRSAI